MDQLPDKHAVRRWLMERQKNRLPLPDRAQMLRDLTALSTRAQEELRDLAPGQEAPNSTIHN